MMGKYVEDPLFLPYKIGGKMRKIVWRSMKKFSENYNCWPLKFLSPFMFLNRTFIMSTCLNKNVIWKYCKVQVQCIVYCFKINCLLVGYFWIQKIGKEIKFVKSKTRISNHIQISQIMLRLHKELFSKCELLT